MSAIEQMPLRHFFGYWEHSLRHLMPMQKQEYYLAQISYLVAATMGSFKGDMTDFLLGEHEMKKQAKQAKADPKENPLYKNFNPIKKTKDK